MSYILEALRKADAQRERARTPGLHAHPLAAAPATTRRSWRGPALMGSAVAAGVASVLLVAWHLAGDAPAPQAAAGAVEGAAAEVAVAAAPPPAPPEPAAAIVPPPPEPLPAPPERPAQVVRTVVVPPQPQPGASAAAVAPAPAPAAAASQAVPMPQQLASAAPAGTPQLAISGGVYSQDPAQRMLIVNGQVFNEGSEVAAGVKLEEVRPKQAVLNFRGQRFTLPY